jgi:threonine synthase
MAETVKATSLLARSEGIFAEPASASVVSALGSAVARGLISRDETVVCVITGAGLKDTKAVARLARETRRVPVRETYFVTRIQVGETKLDLMGMLSRKPEYGYELWQQLSRLRRITTASIYQHLAELETLGLVRRSGTAQAAGRERVLYELTPRGRSALRVSGRTE